MSDLLADIAAQVNSWAQYFEDHYDWQDGPCGCCQCEPDPDGYEGIRDFEKGWMWPTAYPELAAEMSVEEDYSPLYEPLSG